MNACRHDGGGAVDADVSSGRDDFVAEIRGAQHDEDVRPDGHRAGRRSGQPPPAATVAFACVYMLCTVHVRLLGDLSTQSCAVVCALIRQLCAC